MGLNYLIENLFKLYVVKQHIISYIKDKSTIPRFFL